MKELALMMCAFGPSSLIAIVTWWRQPRLRWACLGILTTAAGVVLYLPIRFGLHTPTNEFDGFGIWFEFLVFGGFAVVVHLGLLFAISLLSIEKILERKKAGGNTENV